MKKSIYSLSILWGFLLLPASSSSQGDINLEQIWKDGTYRANAVSTFRSMEDGKHYARISRENGKTHLIKYAFNSGKAIDTIVNGANLNYQNSTIRFDDYHFNKGETKVLLATETEAIYRRSSKSNFYTYDILAKTINPITDFSKGKQELAQFSPTENKVAFVRKNNIYISDLDKKEAIQVSFDGKHGSIINGALDWVYEEEFSFHRGFYWSPEGTKIAFYRFDESEVREFTLTYFTGLYPELYNYKYPKAGETNASVEVKVYYLEDGRTTGVKLGDETDQYIPRIKWAHGDDQLCIMRLNRLQNHLEFLLADTEMEENGTINPKVIYDEKSETYLEINDNLIFLEDGEHFLWNSERDGWNHIYLNAIDGTKKTQITTGEWEVIDFYGANTKTNTVYFNAARESAIASEVYAVNFESALKGSKEFNMEKFMKNLSSEPGINTADFSTTFDFFVHKNSKANTPPTYTLRSKNGKAVRVLESNEELKKDIERLDITPKEFGSFESSLGHSLNYSIIKPSDFDPAKTYPLILMIYGGPGSNRVSNSFDGANYFWHQMLAQKGYIVVSVDPRGTMRRGRDFKHSTYLQLGKLELEDFIETASHFGGKDFIDPERIGIMGWSYGGYMSSLALTKGADKFKLGIAVAPVTNWRFYDSIYTERFMRTPQENPEGYDDNSPINFVDQMMGDYLLIHGGADDNVHPQNTMEMIQALVEADKQFELFIYPDKNHSIYGGNTRYHLYTKMTDFIRENL